MSNRKKTVLPTEIVTAVEDCGFFESFPKRRTPGVCGAMSKMFVGGC